MEHLKLKEFHENLKKKEGELNEDENFQLFIYAIWKQ